MATPDNQDRFQNLMEDHKGILYKVCHSYCKNAGDRDDLAQEITFQLWRSFGGFDQRVRFSTWMYRIALNVAISFYRRERTRTRHVIYGADEHMLEALDESQSQPAEIQILYQWIGELDPLNKALALLYLDGNSHREIAAVLGISETNVATKINRMKENMREKQGGSQHGTR
jgi:RNA polymerase sigma factor (sigma-70 family)